MSPWSEIWADKHSACSLEGGLGHAMQRGGAPTVKGPRTTKRKKKKKNTPGLDCEGSKAAGCWGHGVSTKPGLLEAPVAE